MALALMLIPNQKRKPEELTGYGLVKYLIDHPGEKGDFEFHIKQEKAWVKLLCARPEFWIKCDLSKLPWHCVAEIIVAQPELLHKFKVQESWPLKMFWIRILISQPQLFEHCNVFDDFNNYDWREILRRQPKLENIVIKYRPDWSKYIRSDEYRSNLFSLSSYESLLDDLSRNQQNVTTENPSKYPVDWRHILLHKPEFADYCDFKKSFTKPDLVLLGAHPEWFDRFNWENATFSDDSIATLIKKQPQLTERLMPFFHAENWEYILDNQPKYLLQHKGSRFSFSENTRAFVAADFWSFPENGLDSLCNFFHKCFDIESSAPQGVFQDLSAGDAATCLIYKEIDSANALLYIKKKIREKNWDFVLEINSLAPELIMNIIGNNDLTFLIAAENNNDLFKKYTQNTQISSLCDGNGNTMLHAVLLYTIYDSVKAIFDIDNPYRQRYDYLISQGCDPNKKNKCGFSCNDLIKNIEEKVCYIEGYK